MKKREELEKTITKLIEQLNADVELIQQRTSNGASEEELNLMDFGLHKKNEIKKQLLAEHAELVKLEAIILDVIQSNKPKRKPRETKKQNGPNKN